MTYTQALNNLVNTYTKKYGFPKAEIDKMMKSGIVDYDLSVMVVYNGARMTLGHMYNEPEYFSSSEVAEMLECTEAEVIEKIEELKADLIAQGKDPNEYFIESKPIASFIVNFSRK